MASKRYDPGSAGTSRITRVALVAFGITVAGPVFASSPTPLIFAVFGFGWWIACLLGLFFAIAPICRWVGRLKYEGALPAFLVLVVAFVLTPVPLRQSNWVGASYDYLVLGVAIWLEAILYPWGETKGVGSAFVACSLVAAAGWSILAVAGRLRLPYASIFQAQAPPEVLPPKVE